MGRHIDVLDNKALLISYDTDPKPVVTPPAALHALRARRLEMRLPHFVRPDQIPALADETSPDA